MAKTSDVRFIELGDRVELVFNVQTKPEHGTTKGKAYDAVVVDRRFGLTMEYVNDRGEKAQLIYDRNSERDGYESIELVIGDEPFKGRVEALLRAEAEVLYTDYIRKDKDLKAHFDKIIEKATAK